MSPIPITILTGFLGSGKTTLLNRILREQHVHRIAVIEHEFGEAGIDNELLVQDRDEQIVEMSNGCICCSIRRDLVRILGELRVKREVGALQFDRVILETTGLADPAPIAQTFFVDDGVGRHFQLDAILTLVDARHAPAQLDEQPEAQAQVGFADRLLLSKTDLVSSDDVRALEARLRRINPRAPIRSAHFGQSPVEDLLDIRSFNLNAILDIDPGFLTNVEAEHPDDVASFVFSTVRPFDGDKLEDFLGGILLVYGANLMRYKGVLSVAGSDRRVVLQGVHMIMGSDEGAPWKNGELRQSRLVFIGRGMPRELILAGLEQCVVAPHRTISIKGVAA